MPNILYHLITYIAKLNFHDVIFDRGKNSTPRSAFEKSIIYNCNMKLQNSYQYAINIQILSISPS